MAKKKYGGYKNLHEDKTGLLKHREWRGLKDTLVDYWRWLVTWKDMIVMVLKNPVAVVKGLWRYRWMATYLSTPAFVDRHTEGLRGPQLLMTHLHFNMIVKHATGLILTAFEADEKMFPKNKKSKNSFAWTNLSRQSLSQVSPTSKCTRCKPCPSSFQAWLTNLSCRHTSTQSRASACLPTYVLFPARKRVFASKTIIPNSASA